VYGGGEDFNILPLKGFEREDNIFRFTGFRTNDAVTIFEFFLFDMGKCLRVGYDFKILNAKNPR
jgi:hypothetical protein